MNGLMSGTVKGIRGLSLEKGHEPGGVGSSWGEGGSVVGFKRGIKRLYNLWQKKSNVRELEMDPA